MSIATKFRTVFRGDVSFATLVREAFRRRKQAAKQRAERRSLAEREAAPARLTPEFAGLLPRELLDHFRSKSIGLFIANNISEAARQHFPSETAKLIADAERIVNESKWDLAGFGTLEFTGDNCWRRDPLGSKDWGLAYHADVVLFSNDGADIRVLWELNRFGHTATLACAYRLTNDERYAETFFAQIEAWMRQNPYGRGANWQCAMETALRAINLLAAFELVRDSAACTADRLTLMLQLFDQHGRFTLDNNEFSYFATSNHYLSDIVGLFWIGTVLPELEHAAEWREFGLAEILREMDKQILRDGTDFEASTGYHNFVAQMLLYTFLLARRNGIEIGQRHWDKLRSMFDYIHGIIRPDGRVPLIGDADGSQIVPIVKRDSDDAAYLLAMAAIVFDEPKFVEFAEFTPETLWVLGGDAVAKFNSMPKPRPTSGTAAFPDAGAYVRRDGDLYLHLNANDTGVNGRGSHAHNDALSIEVSAFGRAFIIDPGSYVYNLDRAARDRFRSTAYHSTIMIDGQEQNTTIADLPFVLGDQARPKVIESIVTQQRFTLSAEHHGYSRLQEPVVHRRTVEFDRSRRQWLVTDELTGKGMHEIQVSMHVAPGIAIESVPDAIKLSDAEGGILFIKTDAGKFEVQPAGASRNYGHREDSSILICRRSAELPFTIKTEIIPTVTRENGHPVSEPFTGQSDNKRQL